MFDDTFALLIWLIGTGRSLTTSLLPHHRAYGSWTTVIRVTISIVFHWTGWASAFQWEFRQFQPTQKIELKRTAVQYGAQSQEMDMSSSSRLLGDNMHGYRHGCKDGVGDGIVPVMDTVKGRPQRCLAIAIPLTGGCLQTRSYCAKAPFVEP